MEEFILKNSNKSSGKKKSRNLTELRQKRDRWRLGGKLKKSKWEKPSACPNEF